MAAPAEGVGEGIRKGPEHSFVDAGRAASVEVVRVVRKEPCAACDVELEGKNNRQRNCYGCSQPGRGIAGRGASCKHILADQAVVGSFLSSRYRRQPIRDVYGAACVAGGARLAAAPPVEVSHDDLSFLSKPRSVDDSCVVCVVLPLPDRGRRRARSLGVRLGRAVRRTVRPAGTNHFD